MESLIKNSQFTKRYVLLFCATALYSQTVLSSCGGTTRTWAGTTNQWITTSNWSGTDVPDTSSEDVVIINTGINARFTTSGTVGCVDVQSGVFEGTQNRNIKVTGDYFKAPYSNTLNLTNNKFTIEMGGTTAQTFEAVDDIRDMTISNPSSVTLKNTFRIRSDFDISGTGITYIEGNITFNRTGGEQTIPVDHTLIIKNGATLTARGGLTIDGTVKVEGGGTLIVRNNEILSVSSTGTLELLGASGNPAKLTSDGANKYYIFNMAGTLSASYFQIFRPDIAGINITGTLTQMNNGELRSPNDSGVLMTIGASASMPATMDDLGFFNDDASLTPKNLDASLYTGSVITLDSFSGSIADTAYETDPNSKIDWSAPSPTELSVVNDAEAADVKTFMDPTDEFTFAEYSFSLTQDDTATNITQIKVTMNGTGTMADLEYVRAYVDAGANCNWGVSDVQIGGNLVFTGSPPEAIVNITSGDMTTNGPASPTKCFHIRAKASANPTDQKTIEFEIAATGDVVNDQSYPFSISSGPPVGTEASIIRNPNFSSWSGAVSTSWNNASNWTGGIPGTTRNCTIGVGTNKALVDVNPVTCSTATLQSNGEIDWNSTANKFEVYAGLDVQSSYTFTNASSGIIEMKGTSNQSLSLATDFPGHLIINNSGAGGSNIISTTTNSSIGGNLTCTQGRIDISSGVTLSVSGNVTVATGCELSIGAGGVLSLGSGSSLTVDSGGTLTVVGNSSSSAKITTSSTANAMNIVVNGTIKANYYTFEHLAASGVSIESGATIDPTYYMQNGSFLYPVDDNTTLLFLKKQIPGNTLASMVFDDGGSGAVSPDSIDTSGAASGTLSITSYSGNISEVDTDPLYLISWSGATNTIDLTQEATSPASVTVESTYNMGRFGFTQSAAGASFSDSDITSLKLTLTGTGTASDILAVNIYSDSDCDGAAGTLLGTGTYSGVPASKTFTITAGQLTVDASTTSPPKRCLYVEYEIASGATNGNTVGVKIASGSDFIDSQAYGISSGTPAPVTLGSASTIDAPTTTIWTGATSTDWSVASNWSAGLPSSAKSCEIPNVANDPIISSGTVVCDDVNITTGILTLNVSTTLQAFGDFTNTGTFTQNGTLEIEDGGAFSVHYISSTSTLENLHVNKTGIGQLYIDDTALTINSLITNSTTAIINVKSGKKLILPNGLNLTNGELKLWGNSSVEIGSGQALTTAGGYFNTVGVSDTFPQAASTKAFIGPQGGTGTWSFTATSGTVKFKGFHFDKLDNSGINIGGTTAVTTFTGGQLTNLSTSYASMKAIQINTSGSIVSSATNIAWTWGAFNSFDPATAGTPVEADGYTLISSTGCGSQVIDFTGWTGDWYETQTSFDTSAKVSSSACTINLGASSSSIALTDFTIAGYDSAIDLKWETTHESNHRGFNVYRANDLASEFQQINTTLLKNLNNAGQLKGKYRFVDNDVTNGTQYYYYIEDVEVTGARVLHGPKSDTPYASLGAVPADAADENSGGNTDDGDDGGTTSGGTIANPSYRDLGNGAIIHSQTSSALRIEIDPAAPSFSASSWDGSYEDITMLGYTQMDKAGSPAMLERDILIEVYNYANTASIIGTAQITSSVLSGHNISPAPTYTLDGNGALVASYNPDATIYSTNSNTFNDFYNIENQLIKVSGKTFLRLKIKPLLYNPATDDIVYASKIILDIGLDNQTWEATPPSDSSNINPFNIANTLRIDYTKSGVFELKYNDLVSSLVEAPFDGVDLSELRLYVEGEEIPLYVSPGDNLFSAGDYLRFYLPFNQTLEDLKNTAILSTVDLGDNNEAAKRMELVDANPTGVDTAGEDFSLFTKTYEQNLSYETYDSLGDNLDHYAWALLASYGGGDELAFTMATPELDPTSDYNVSLKFHIKGQFGYSGNLFDHHVSLFVDGVEEDEIIFFGNDRKVLTFEIPADRFVAGNNNIKLKINGTYVSAGHYDRLFVDKLDVEYVGHSNGGTGLSKIIIEETLVSHTVENFTTNNISIFDITNSKEARILTNTDINGSGPYSVSFVPDDRVDDKSEKTLLLIENGSYLVPTGLSLNIGYPNSLKDTSNAAKLLLIGHKSLLEASKEFITHKESNGVSVKAVTLEQIYGEFSQGKKSSKAIKDFINYSLDYWSTAPKYAFILGDGTLDPLNHNVGSLTTAKIISTDVQTIPMPFYAGRFNDFGADHFFATNSTSALPRIAIGRLPTNSPLEVKQYGQKVIAYETKTSIPVSDNLKNIVFVTGANAEIYDKFDERSHKVKNLVTNFDSELISRTILGDDATTLSSIDSAFSDTPFLMSFMGHGANDRTGKFTTTQVQSLSNTKLPITMTWDCETAYYYNPDKTMASFGAKLVLKESGGSIVFIGSTAQTTPTAQERLATAFFNTLNSEIGSYYTGETIGDIFIQSKISLGDGAYTLDILNSQTLIGDPSLKIPASMFAPAPEVARAAPPASEKGGGCSLFASTGAGSSIPWYFGLLEWMLYIIGPWVLRKFLRNTKY